MIAKGNFYLINYLYEFEDPIKGYLFGDGLIYIYEGRKQLWIIY